MTLVFVHARISSIALIYSAAVGLWALYTAYQKRDLDSNFWGALAINELIFVAQTVIGLLMVAQGAQPARAVHYLYGAVGILTIPAAFAYTRGQGARREALIYGLICLFLAGVSIRAAGTGAIALPSP